MKRYSIPLTAEQFEARKSMPTNHDGYIVGLPWIRDKDVPAMEAQWREWCRSTPRHLWPDWLDTWKDVKRLRGLA